MTEYGDLKSRIDALSPQDLAALGYIKMETAESVTQTLSNTFSDLLDAVKCWSENVVAAAEKSNNPQIMAFATKHLMDLKKVFSQKLSKLGVNEKH